MSGRIRTIKPEWLEDEKLALASCEARVLSVALMLLADDYGNGRASKPILAGQAFPGKPIELLSDALAELAAIEYVTFYTVNGQSYFSIRNWSKHQRVDKPGKPRVPTNPDSIGKVPEIPGTDHDLDPDQDQDQHTPTAAVLPGFTEPAPEKKKNKTTLPKGFVFSDKQLQLAAEMGWPEWWIRYTFDVFLGKAESKGFKYANWNAGFTNFAKNEIIYRRGPKELAHIAPKSEIEPIRGDVSSVHRTWQEALKRQDKLFGPVDDNAMVIARAIDAYGLPDTVLVARYAPFDGMVSGRDDQNKVKHESMAYIFGNTAAFGRILKMAKQKEAETHTETMAERTARLKLL